MRKRNQGISDVKIELNAAVRELETARVVKGAAHEANRTGACLLLQQACNASVRRNKAVSLTMWQR